MKNFLLILAVCALFTASYAHEEEKTLNFIISDTYVPATIKGTIVGLSFLCTPTGALVVGSLASGLIISTSHEAAQETALFD